MKRKKIFFLILSTLALFISTDSFSQNKLKNNKVYTIVESAPEYPGGQSALMDFLSGNIQYPSDAKVAGIKGTVYVSFIVEKNGSVSGFKVNNGIGGGCDEEVLRVLRLMKKWKPGKQNGKTVRVLYNLPVKFSL